MNTSPSTRAPKHLRASALGCALLGFVFSGCGVKGTGLDDQINGAADAASAMLPSSQGGAPGGGSGGMGGRGSSPAGWSAGSTQGQGQGMAGSAGQAGQSGQAGSGGGGIGGQAGRGGSSGSTGGGGSAGGGAGSSPRDAGVDRSAPPAPDATAASDTAPPAPDMTPVVPSSVVACGNMSCPLSTSYCCSSTAGLTCQAIGKDCPGGGAIRRCDAREDCREDKNCCARLAPVGGFRATCEDSCDSNEPELCRTNADCHDGDRCCPMTMLGLFQAAVCRKACN